MFSTRLLPHELKEKAALQRRAAAEELRKKRIFHPKMRTIGIDVEGIQRQINEKIKEREITKAIEKNQHQHILHAVKVADDISNSISESRKRVNKELTLFWKTCQRKEDRREYHLTQPVTYVENETDLGISSGQVFDGEDFNKNIREEIQSEQQRNWLVQQIMEKKQSEEKIKLAEKIYQDCLTARESRALYLDELEKQCKMEINKAHLAYNEALVRENKFNKNVTNERELKDKEMEIVNTTNSDLLMENPEVARSNLGLHKVIQYHYKGMTQEELLEIREAQLRQIQQNKSNRETEKAYLRKWDKFYEAVDQVLVSQTQYQDHQERQLKKLINEENKMLSREKEFRLRQEKLYMASDYSTKEFQDKLNQSSR